MKNKFKSVPIPMKKQIIGRFIIGSISLIVAIIMLAVSKDFILGLPGLLLLGYLVADGGRLLYCGFTGKYVVVSGACLKVERTSIRRRVKSLTIQTEKGRMKIPARKRIKRVNEGDDVTVYLSVKARIFEQDGGFIVFGYYAIDIR